MSAERARRALKTALAAAVLAAALSPAGCAPAPTEDGGKAVLRNDASAGASANASPAAISGTAASTSSKQPDGSATGTLASGEGAKTAVATPSPKTSPAVVGGRAGGIPSPSVTDATESSRATPSGDDGRGGSTAAIEPFVVVSVVGDDARGVILAPVRVKLETEHDTALDVLLRAAQEQGVPVKYRGRGRTAYIEAIGGLSEFDRGPMSGWLYRVGGVFPNVGAGAYRVRPGDRVEFLYTTDGGRDVREVAP